MRTSRIDSFSNLSPLYTVVCTSVVSICKTSAVNFMVGWYEFACSMKCSISSLFASHKQNTSSMNLFHVSGFLTLCLKISLINFNKCHRASIHDGISKTNSNGSE